MTLVVVAALALGWEGMICAVMALPLLLLISSAGGMMTYAEQVRSTRTLPILIVLPYLIAPFGRRIPEPAWFGETVTSTGRISSASIADGRSPGQNDGRTL